MTESRKVEWEFFLGDFVSGYIPGVPAYKIMLAGGGYAEIEANRVFKVPYRF